MAAVMRCQTVGCNRSAVRAGRLVVPDPLLVPGLLLEVRVCILCERELPQVYVFEWTCSECAEINRGFGPSHDGSASCESGSLASGGRNSHCTCDTCF